MSTRRSALRTFLRLLVYARRYWGLAILMFVTMAAYSALHQGRVILAKPLFDDALGKYDWKLLQNISLLALGLSIPIAILNYLHSYLEKYIMLRVMVDIRMAMCGHMLNLPLRFFHERKAGDILSRLTNDVAATQNAVEVVFGDMLLQPFLVLAALGSAFYLAPALGAVTLVLVPILLWPIIKIGRRIRRAKRGSLAKLGDVTEAIHQMFSGIRIVKAFRMEEAEKAEFAGKNKEFLSKSLKVVKNKALSSAIVQLSYAVALAAIFFLGGYLVVKGKFGITTGTLAGFVLAMGALSHPTRGTLKAYNTLQESLAAADRIFEMMDTPPQPEDDPNAISLEGITREIRFRNVFFTYSESGAGSDTNVPSAQPISADIGKDNLPGSDIAEISPVSSDQFVLRNVSFTVERGKVVALVGPSGAGKSTLLDLVCRFYDPQSGAVEIDGVDIRNISRASLLRHIAIVTQDTFLFNTSIAENIRYGRKEATMAEIEAAARAANIHDFIASLPEGYETVIGERGAKLSGGQRQRLAIARAILKNPTILLLDEATSALDSESEQVVQEALATLMKGRTSLVIAHRLSTIHNADLIVVLDNGEVVEQGKHEELLAAGKLYARLYRMQFKEMNT